jgi:hypothetical protein
MRSDLRQTLNKKALREGEEIYGGSLSKGEVTGIQVAENSLKPLVHLFVIFLMLPGTTIAGIIVLLRHMGH